MKSLRTFFSVPSVAFAGLAVVVTLAGCTAETSANAGAETATATAAQSQTVTTDGSTSAAAANAARPPMGPHHGMGGPEFLVFASLHENINLTADQKTAIEAILAKDAPKPPPRDPARVAALAAAIRSGNVANLPAPPNDDAERAAHLAAAADALTTLHSTLTKDQRVALVAAVSAKHDGGPHGDHGDHGGPGPNGGGGGPGAHGDHGGHGGPMGGLLEGLDLTAQQRDAIKAKFEANRPSEADRAAMEAKFAAHKQEMAAKLATFSNDTFDATAFVTPPADAKPDAAHRPNELALIVPILDAAQREKLAERIEQGPPAHPAPPPAPPAPSAN